jgi:hypothetical protein
VRSDQPRKKEPARAAFDTQATPALLDKVYRAARARMQIYAGRMQHVNAADVDDMVSGVVTDTLVGSLAWDYQRKPLLRHLLDTVRYRVRDEARRRWRETARFEELDEETTDASVGESMLVGAEPKQPDDSLCVRQIADLLVAEVRKAIAGDRDVMILFDAIVMRGAFERAEILKETGLSAGAYKNARRRLDFILLQVPIETHDAVMSAFTN